MPSRILIADDHEMVRRGIRALLESSGRDVQVLEASDGKEAVEKTMDSKPDLVILDISMPLLDGFSAAKEIKKTSAGTPILFLTFEKNKILTELAHGIGVSGYITKGEDGDALLKAIDAAIGDPSARESGSDDFFCSPMTIVPPDRPSALERDSSRSRAETIKGPQLRILIIHSEPASIKRCVQELRDVQLRVEADVALTFEQCAERLQSRHYDIVLAEFPCPNLLGKPAPDLLSRTAGHVPVILLTHEMEKETAADLITEGAADCVEIDNLGELPIAIRRALKENCLLGARERAEQKLQRSEAHYRALTGNLAFGICRCDLEGEFVDVNPALVTMLGFASKEELLKMSPAADVINDVSKRARLLGEVGENGRVDLLETVWSRKNGIRLRVRLSGREIRTAEGEIDGYEIIVQDVTKQRELEDKLRQQATRDPLTGLANYRYLLGVLNSEIRRFKRTGREFAVVLFDLDGLKQINDRYGHLTGGEALCRLGDVLAAGCRSIDTAARFGGDEFAVVLPETGAEAARLVAQRLCDNLANDGRDPQLSVSAGVAIYPADGEAIETLLVVADKMLYANKSKLHAASRAGC
jgi:diguanylate cyclase (GGDEF)-like protein/PAS domain S-box-containing protein